MNERCAIGKAFTMKNWEEIEQGRDQSGLTINGDLSSLWIRNATHQKSPSSQLRITTEGVNMNTANASWIMHPGFYLKEEMDARGWLQRDLSFILGCSEQTLNMLLAGKRGISPD